MSGGTRVHRLTVSGMALVAKSARGGSRQHLRREAELLDHLRGLPVVELIALRDSDDRTDLVTLDAGDRDLSRPDGLTPEQLLAALADTAAAVAELHAAGWTHGALCAQHVVVGGGGTVRLCSLGSAAVRCDNGGGAGAAARSDVQQLVSMIDHVLHHRDDSWSPSTAWAYRSAERRFRRELERSNTAATKSPVPGSAAELSDILEVLAGEDLRRVSVSPLSGRPLRLVGAAVGVGVLGLTWGAVAAGQDGDQHPSKGPAPLSSDPTDPCSAEVAAEPSTATGPDLDEDGCPDHVEVVDNILTVGGHSFRAGQPGDQVVVAPITCDAPPQVILFRPSSSELFVFDEWPGSAASATAQHLGTYPGAVSLGVHETDGCTRAVPIDAQGTSVPEEKP
ncbi:MAG: hypothetical protein V9E94_17900 [Microthrixaceae bacterium]